MKSLPTLCLLCLLALPAQAARRVGEAQVRAGANGVPCFTISQREETRGGTPDFASVTVMAEGQEAAMWRMSMPRERTFPVAHSMCIPYAGRVPALPQTPALALAPGTLYTVHIDSRPGGSSVAPLRYQARFCLVQGSGAPPRVLPVGANMRRGRNLYGCLPGPA